MFVDWFLTDYPTWMLLTELLGCGLAVLLIGSQLTYQADAICEEWNLGRAWVGLLLLAGITSMPELVVGSTGVLLGQPDMSMGNILGSCCFNIAIISLLTTVTPKGDVGEQEGNPAHVLSAGFGIVLIAVALMMVAMVEEFGTQSPQANITEWILGTVIAIGYMICMKLLYEFERRFAAAAVGDVTPAKKKTNLIPKFCLSGFAIIAAAIWLTKTGDVLQDHPIDFWGGRKLGGTFVGLFFLAVGTSLPEIVTCFAAVRMGRVDLALGNIFGSNMFNIFLIPLLKIIATLAGHKTLLGIGGVFDPWKSVFAGMLAIALTGVAIAGLMYRSRHGRLRFGFDSAVIVILYVAGMYFLLMT